MRYRTAIFDMDGTILDTLADITDSINVSLFREGFPVRTEEEVRAAFSLIQKEWLPNDN